MQKAYQELLHTLKQRHDTMVQQLHELCEINSGSHHLAGLKKAHHALRKLYTPLADDIQSIALPSYSVFNMTGEKEMQSSGNVLFIRKRPELKRRVLLCGHMDTVYGERHPFQTLSYLDDNTLNAPGAADMKGGLLVMLHALEAFEQTPVAKQLGWDVVINADEEIGSPASSSIYESIASDYSVGLVYEPAMNPSGTLAKNRRGSGKLTLIATGKAAHAGRAFSEGRNAIYHLSRAITKIHLLNGEKNNVNINVGKVVGGTALNMVPDKAVAKLDVRINHPDDEKWVFDKINFILNDLKTEGYTLSLQGRFNRPVKQVNVATKLLFQRVQQLGQKLGLNIDWQDSGGCCDGNNLAQHGLAVLDTLGVRGGNIHTSEEYILLDSLVERASLSALLLIDLAQGGLETLTPLQASEGDKQS